MRSNAGENDVEDLIQLEGQTTVVRILTIDYASNVLTVDAPLSWEVGTGVSQPFFGARPDQGVFEHP